MADSSTTASRPAPPRADVEALAGHRFPGGRYTIAHWENFLLTDCTGAEQLPGQQVHPVALFHVPIFGANTSIAEMFALGQAESDDSIGIESYDWELFRPLREAVEYEVSGHIASAERCEADDRTFDRIAFCFELQDPDGTLSARTTITWHFRRTTP